MRDAADQQRRLGRQLPECLFAVPSSGLCVAPVLLCTAMARAATVAALVLCTDIAKPRE
jgi:hypothetical protein